MIRALSFLILASVVLAQQKCDETTSYVAFAGEPRDGQTSGNELQIKISF